MTTDEVNLLPSRVHSHVLTQDEQDKLLKITDKLRKKKKQIRIKRAISKTFVFDDTWQRQPFRCETNPDPLIEDFYKKHTFENQRQFGSDIFTAFGDLNTTHVLAIAPTQSGKTGSMLAIARMFNQSDAKSLRVDARNIFIFTGHSSTEWTEQTKQRFPESMSCNIFHRNNLKRFVKLVTDLDNILIIFDESHIANQYGQTLYSLYNQLGFFNIKRLYRKNIKIVHFTATPGSLMHNIDMWRNSLKVLHMQVPNNYVSTQSYCDNNQVFDVKPLHDNIDNIKHILKHIDIIDPFYHIIRTPRGHKHAELINDFRHAFAANDFEFISEPSYSKRNNIYNLFKHKPLKHTFIFIIDKMRCAKSLHIQNIQILYDRFVYKPNYDSVLQGLIGRCTGYRKHTSQLRIFTFTHILHSQTIQHKHNNIFYPY